MKAAEALAASLDRYAGFDDPAVVIAQPTLDWLHATAAEIDARPDVEVPLRGTTFALKDNIDLAGLPTTAGCPSFATTPDRSAPVVERLMQAGALPVFKVNLDQFATGLVGTRSPYGTPRNPIDPQLVPGGSSSGSAVAVASGLTTFALGTDTAGSGRVPAAMCGIVGVKPTSGRLSTSGVVPAVRSIDCVSVFAGSVGEGAAIASLAAGHDPTDPYSRRSPSIGCPPVRRIGVLDPAVLNHLGVEPFIATTYVAMCDLLRTGGYEIDAVDPSELFAMGDELYGGPWVSERLVAVDEFAGSGPDDLDPVVAGILAGARSYSVVDLHRARYRLERRRHVVARLFDQVDALAFPTIGWHVTLADVAADPVGHNTKLGRFTTFTNFAGLSALTFPMAELGRPGDRLPPPSLTLHGAPWADDALADVACALNGEERAGEPPPGWVRLAVAGAHLRGQPLDWQLLDRGAFFVGTTGTAPEYGLYALADSVPPKPALVHRGDQGVSIEVDVWALTPGMLGDFLQVVASPLCLGNVALEDGSTVSGFLCEPRALDGATDITPFGGWRAYRAGLVSS